MNTVQKVALVTGAGSGVGKASAILLNKHGYHVVLVGRGEAKLELTAGACVDTRAVTIFPADIGDPDQVDRLFDTVEERLGRIDVLFNNAGSGAPAVPVDELAVEQWMSVVSVNLNGAFFCARRAFGLMRTQKPAGGRIINNGSISAQVPRPFSAPYTATKHAMTGLTRSLSLDGRAHNIACGQVDIGNAATEMTDRMVDGVIQADGSVRTEPRIDVQHVAKAVVQMAELPLDVNIQFMTIMATAMPYIGRG